MCPLCLTPHPRASHARRRHHYRPNRPPYIHRCYLLPYRYLSTRSTPTHPTRRPLRSLYRCSRRCCPRRYVAPARGGSYHHARCRWQCRRRVLANTCARCDAVHRTPRRAVLKDCRRHSRTPCNDAQRRSLSHESSPVSRLCRCTQPFPHMHCRSMGRTADSPLRHLCRDARAVVRSFHSHTVAHRRSPSPSPEPQPISAP